MIGSLPELPEGYYWKVNNPGRTFESLHCMRRNRSGVDKSVHGFYVGNALEFDRWDWEIQVALVMAQGGAE